MTHEGEKDPKGILIVIKQKENKNEKRTQISITRVNSSNHNVWMREHADTAITEITGSYISGLRYEDFDCRKLAAESDSLSRRENQLVIAQEQRIKTSQTQAFWWGFGQGDGIEASELANVKGEKEAVRKAMETKGCQQPITNKPQN